MPFGPMRRSYCIGKRNKEKNGREADALRLMAVMSLGLKQGAEMTVRVEGEDEEQAAEAMKAFLEANL